jgi:teichuronic acid exporter
MVERATTAAGDGLAHLTARRTRASVTGVAWSLLTVGLSAVLALSVFLITSRVLSPADFGAVALAVASISIVSMLVPVAFGEALIQRRDLRAAPSRQRVLADLRHGGGALWGPWS